MKKAVGMLLLLAMAGSTSSCFLFKKKCDCPKFGAAGTGFVRIPEAGTSSMGKKTSTHP